MGTMRAAATFSGGEGCQAHKHGGGWASLSNAQAGGVGEWSGLPNMDTMRRPWAGELFAAYNWMKRPGAWAWRRLGSC